MAVYKIIFAGNTSTAWIYLLFPVGFFRVTISLLWPHGRHLVEAISNTFSTDKLNHDQDVMIKGAAISRHDTLLHEILC
jgi:hypothetical protein